jgi:hypothetical protein
MLAFEISLTRVLAIQQFHHFGFLIISLAVMGISASGVLLTFIRSSPHYDWIAAAFAVSIMAAYFTINFLPFDSFSIAWDQSQTAILVLYFIAVSVPFLLAGWVIGGQLAEAGERANLPYAANLFGSALGCGFAVAILARWGVEGAVMSAVSLALFAAAFFSGRRRKQVILGAAALILLAINLQPLPAFQLKLSPYKALSIMRLVPDSRQTLQILTPSARVDVIETDTFRSFPGLSLNANAELPAQAGVFVDGDGPIPITHLNLDRADDARFTESMPSALAYILRPNASALILQSGGGLNATIALSQGAASVSLSEDEPVLLGLLSGPYLDYSYGLLEDGRVKATGRTNRGQLAQGSEEFQVIEFALSDAYRPIASGAFSLTENYTLTVDSFREAFDRLSDDGLLVITRWLGTPPSESARAWVTLRMALLEAGAKNPARHMAAFRGMRTATMLASKQPFSPDELAVIRSFLYDQFYDPVFLPDLSADEVNLRNVLPEPVYYQLFTNLMVDPEKTTAAYEFQLQPPRDNHPYFYHFFRWRQTPSVIAALGTTWQPFGGSGYFVLLVLLMLVLVFAAALVLSPYLVQRRVPGQAAPGKYFILFFACLGAGYLLVEIPLIQSLTLLLDKPVHALVVVLFSMLVASGVGSLASPRLPLAPAIVALIFTILLLSLCIPIVSGWALAWNLPFRVVLVISSIFPLGFLMGIPFASGLRLIGTKPGRLIPWAWAVNGAASGVSGVIAALVAIDFGFSVVLYLAAFVYAGALLSANRLSPA